MDHDDRATQALDDFWKCMEQWREVLKGYFVLTKEDKILSLAYDAWLDASKPPGDPHKEWVDASKLKPNDVFQPVLVKTISDKTGLANWVPGRNFDGVERSWHVQLFMEGWYWTKEDGVTHWRYIPNMED